MSQQFEVWPSEFVQAVIKIRGRKFSFGEEDLVEYRYYLKDIYDETESPNLVMVGGRQIEKSTTLANIMIIN